MYTKIKTSRSGAYDNFFLTMPAHVVYIFPVTFYETIVR